MTLKFDSQTATFRRRPAILNDIRHLPEAKPEFKDGAKFFDRFRDLVATGYYTTAEGMKDIGYIGNVPTKTFEGPSEELLKKLGLA